MLHFATFLNHTPLSLSTASETGAKVNGVALLLSRGSVTCTQDYYLSQEYTTTPSTSIHCYKYWFMHNR